MPNSRCASGFPGDSVSKESTCSAGDHLQCRLHGFNPWVRKIPGKEMATHTSILAWRIPWTEGPSGIQSLGQKESDMNEQLTHTSKVTYSVGIYESLSIRGTHLCMCCFPGTVYEEYRGIFGEHIYL